VIDIEDAVRRLIREELASLLADGVVPAQGRPARAITDIDRARAHAALRKLGVVVPEAKARR
jgi:hypothetical protein